MSHKDLAKIILKDVGGAENVSAVTHCSTRLRLILRDVRKADTPHLREVRGILGVLMSGDYYMVVIGKGVDSVYRELRDILYGREVKRPEAAHIRRGHTGISLLVYIVVTAGIASAAVELTSVWSMLNINGDIVKTLNILSGLGVYLLPLIFLRILEEKKPLETQPHKTVICAPVKGRIIKLSEHSDSAFADSVYGDGCAIIPETNLIVSPVSGRVTSVTQTGNAVTVTADSGAEILIHTGCAGCDLGKGIFRTFVSENDRVRVGDPLLEFEKNALEIEGAKLTTAVVVTNSEKYDAIKALTDIAQEQQPFMEITG